MFKKNICYEIIIMVIKMKYLAICDFDGTLCNNSQISNTSIEYIQHFIKDNLLYIISYEKFDILYQNFKEYHSNLCFFSLEDNKWYINNKIIDKKIKKESLNKILTSYKNDIYTMYSHNDISEIYNYQERLSLLYPKNNISISEYKEDSSKVTIAINNNKAQDFKTFLVDNNIFYDEYAKDKNREIIIISAIPNTKEEITKMVINNNKNLISIGIADDINDYKYLKHCNIKIAMLNSNYQLKKLCDRITKYSVDDDGCMLELLNIYNS